MAFPPCATNSGCVAQSSCCRLSPPLRFALRANLRLLLLLLLPPPPPPLPLSFCCAVAIFIFTPQYMVNEGTAFSKRSTWWDAIFMCFSSRNENVGGMLMQLLFKFVMNFTIGESLYTMD